MSADVVAEARERERRLLLAREANLGAGRETVDGS